MTTAARYLVNGKEVDLETFSMKAEEIEIYPLQDRLFVRTAKGGATALVLRHGSKTLLSIGGRTYKIEKNPARIHPHHGIYTDMFTAPMPGNIVEVFVKPGEHVQKGQKLLVLEAMKTQTPIHASSEGRVKEIRVKIGSQVKEGEILVLMEAEE
jgi:biotin carboxyl carrier protein